MQEYVIGIDLGATNTKVGLFDRKINIIHQLQTYTDNELDAQQMMDHLESQVRQLLEDKGVLASQVRGIGAAFPSFIDYENGIVVETSNIISLNDLPVRKLLSNRLGIPVWLDNDANAAALAEHRMGAGRGHDNFIYATLSTGIGGALILNGGLYRGMHGMAGEIGHMFISDSTGYPCSCGVSGCIQSISSGVHMARFAIDRMKEGMDSLILDHAGTMANVDMIAVARALAAGDSLALEVVNRGAEYLGRMFHSLSMIFDINVFVYGGGVTKLGKRFTDRIIAAYRHYSLMDQKYPAKFLIAELGDSAGLIGAALMVPEN
ncbi:MAG: ROK family protein [Christensenellales bacterium]|nr:ROK family protein [Christensenellales bacterium]